MLPAPRLRLLQSFSRLTGVAALALTALCRPHAAAAQETPAAPAAGSTAEEPIGFEADGASYDDTRNIVSAFGNVIMRRGNQSVRADKLTWDRVSGRILAEGNIRFVDEDGNQLFTDKVELTEELKAGAMENMLLVLREGGRLAANRSVRGVDEKVELQEAVYSACAVEDSHGCAQDPSWRIVAKRVVYDPKAKKVHFKDGRLELFGTPILPMPGLVLRSDGKPQSGFLIPDVRFSASNGVELSSTWYHRLAENRDLAITGYVYSETLPMVRAQYRALVPDGAYQITGYATRSKRISISPVPAGSANEFRGYLAGNGRFQFTPKWSLTFSGRLTTDRTFLRRYDISRDDRLRSMIDLERIGTNSYLSIAGWATQTLRVNDRQGLVPVALPAIDYRKRLGDPVLGGRVEFQANSLAITRTSGQDSQRAFASARWDLRRITGLGQEVTLTALARGDVYHSDGNATTATAIYRGNPGWQARGIATAAIDVKWPMVGAFGSGNQILTPRFQVVASPTLRNLAVPNEDARAIDLEDSNLFALNRFPGYDRIEDGVRFTYGFDWQWERPGWRVLHTMGQSYRLTTKPTLLPQGTGLTSRTSDLVGRTEVRWRDVVKLTHRFRIDKDGLALRRSEIDLAVGSRRTYLELGYLQLNRNVTAGIEDLRDREELRLAGRVGFARYWSIFGSGVFDLTSRKDAPASPTADGFQPMRTRLGLAYQDDCLELGLTWRRDFRTTGDARKGNNFQFYFSLKNLGFR